MTDWESARTVALLVIFIGMSVFCGEYLFRRPWRAHFIGVALGIFALCFWAITGLGVIYRLQPDWAFESQSKGILYWAMAAAVWWLLLSLFRQRYEDLTRPKPYSDPDQPESWYWLEWRPSGYFTALPPPGECEWVLVMRDLELEWFASVNDAADSMQGMVEKDLSIVSATKRQQEKR